MPNWRMYLNYDWQWHNIPKRSGSFAGICSDEMWGGCWFIRLC